MRDRTTRASRDPARPGTRITHYEIVSELGRGGMGVVFRAKDLKLGRDVALKCPRPDLAEDPSYRRRFLREARAVARLSHSHIVPLFEAFEQNGLPWISMQLVEGDSLRRVLSERGALPVEEVLSHAEGLASALAAAHAHDVIHRDVNPKNVIISRDGRALLTDFGLARILNPPDGSDSSGTTRQAEITGERMVVGTPGYMSPEQLMGRTLDGRSDLFSLGAVIYEMATNRPAFSASQTGDAFGSILNGEPAPISSVRRGVPSELDRIVRIALAKEPEARYATADSLRKDLLALKTEVDSRRLAEERPGARRLRRVALAVGIAAVAAIGWLLGPRREAMPTLGVSKSVSSTRDGYASEPAVSPDGRYVAYVARRAGETAILVSDLENLRGGDPIRVTSDAAPKRAPAWFPDGVRLAYSTSRAGRSEDVMWIPPSGGTTTLLLADAFQPAVSPGGDRIAFVRNDANREGRIHVAPIGRADAAIRLTSDGDGEWSHESPAWSPDGESLCYATHSGLYVVAADGSSKPRRLTTEPDEDPAWSSDGRYVWFSSSRDGARAIWRVAAGGGTPERLTTGTGPESNPTVSRDGRRLLYTTFRRRFEIGLVDADGGGAVKTLPWPRSGNETFPALSPDGRWLAFIDHRDSPGDVWILSLDPAAPGEAAEPVRLTTQTGCASHPAFSPDGRFIAYYRIGVGDDRSRDIWIVPRTGGEPAAFTLDGKENIQPAWSPSGDHLGYVSARDGASRVWIERVVDGRSGGDAQRLTSDDRQELAPAFSPDGSRVAYVSDDGDGWDVFVAPLDGKSAPKRITFNGHAQRVRWVRASAEAGGGVKLVVSGSFDGETLSLAAVSPDGGPVEALYPSTVVFGSELKFGAPFDVTPDGRRLVFRKENLSGEVSMLEAEPGTY